jgi:hypothetical protein
MIGTFALGALVRNSEGFCGAECLVEGFFDCPKVQAIYGNVVALMEAGVPDRQAELPDTYFRELVEMLDGAEAGWRARMLVVPAFRVFVSTDRSIPMSIA